MLDPFYPIADSAYMLCRLVNAGAKLVQLRIKDKAIGEIREELRASWQVCQAAGAQLVLNDYWQIAIDQGCDFVHLGQQDLDSADLDAIRRADIKIGISTHSHEELERALALKPEYIALGPIYPTLLKKMPWAPQGLARITEWKKRIGNLPLVAIGGITLERAPECLAAGADIIGVVTDVVRAEDPQARATAWIKAIRVDA